MMPSLENIHMNKGGCFDTSQVFAQKQLKALTVCIICPLVLLHR